MASSSPSRHLFLRRTSRQSSPVTYAPRRPSTQSPWVTRAVSTASDHSAPFLPSSSSSSSAPRTRAAHHAASPSPSSYTSRPPPPAPPSLPSAPRSPPSRPRKPQQQEEEDLTAEFAASLQRSLAADDAERAVRPQWEDDGRNDAFESDEQDGGLFVGEVIGGDEIGAEVFEAGAAEGTEGGEDWVDWRELLSSARGGMEGKGEERSLRKVREEARKELQRAEKVDVKEPVVLPSLSTSTATSKPPASIPSFPPPPAPQLAPSPSSPLSATANLFAPLPRPPRLKNALPRLDPVVRLTHASLEPYLPPPLSSAPSLPSPPAHYLEPHFTPLLSRQDWRLSSPLRRFLRTSPPPLFSLSETDTMPLGHGRLVGVGVQAARSARRGLIGKETRGEEGWGWKVRVPEGERGKWDDAEGYEKRMLRLLTLSRTADEHTYQSSLARSGTPAERERKGITVCRAVGVWLSDTGKGKGKEGEGEGKEGKAVRAEKEEGKKGKEKGKVGAKVVAEWRAEDEGELTEEGGYKFVEGSILRFTLASSSSSHLPATTPLTPSGPQPPLGGEAALTAGSAKWFVQGSVLEIRDGRLIVGFDEEDMWALGEEAYQIDIGLDDTSYALQESALSNLYFDPERQRRRNALHVETAQNAFVTAGVTSTLREWTLQGTELREVVVPSSVVAPVSETSSPWGDGAAALSPITTAVDSRLPLPSPAATATPVDPSAPLHPSPLLRQNQLINSWILRYQREDPIVLPGDPELGLNGSQTRAIAMALGEKMSLIQGPPGTGKSQTIVSLIALLKLHFRVPFPILLAAPTHVSIDHLLTLLIRAGLNPLRCGKASKVSNPEAEKWTIEKRQEGHPLWGRMEAAREESEEARRGVLELREAVAVGEVEQKKADQAGFVLEEKYRKSWRKFVMLEQKLYASLLATADVFCATALGSGASKVLGMVDFPLVLLDEAAMCTEPVSLIPLMKGAQHATLIGDHKQLPAVVTSQEAKSERLHISLFERLLATKAVKSTLLDTQYRMRPDISAFPNLSFYKSALRDASIVSQRPPPPKSRFFSTPPSTPPSSTSSPSTASTEPIPVAFVTHQGAERMHRQSCLNRQEVDLLVEIVGDLLDRNPTLAANDIGIISPYYAQTRLLINTFESGFASSKLRPLLGTSRAAEVAQVEVNTVDGFQGREKRVVLLSTVRSNRNGTIGFLTDRRRLNVALTRARDALIVVGNQETLKRAAGNEWTDRDPDADSGVWRRFLGWCERRGLVTEYVRAEAFEEAH